MADLKQFETALMKRLSHPGLDKSFLKQASASILEAKRLGFQIDDIYVKGQPAFDKIIVKGIPAPDFLVKSKNLLTLEHFRRFEIFPKGIINPDVFGAELTFGY